MPTGGWAEFFTGLTGFIKGTGIPAVIVIGAIILGWQFFKNPPWGSRRTPKQ